MCGAICHILVNVMGTLQVPNIGDLVKRLLGKNRWGTPKSPPFGGETPKSPLEKGNVPHFFGNVSLVFLKRGHGKMPPTEVRCLGNMGNMGGVSMCNVTFNLGILVTTISLVPLKPNFNEKV
jgi:hypothetical protein